MTRNAIGAAQESAFEPVSDTLRQTEHVAKVPISDIIGRLRINGYNGSKRRHARFGSSRAFGNWVSISAL
jgi:hypothetical protein